MYLAIDSFQQLSSSFNDAKNACPPEQTLWRSAEVEVHIGVVTIISRIRAIRSTTKDLFVQLQFQNTVW